MTPLDAESSLLDELRSEVRSQRASGLMDLSYERWMDRVFEGLSPGSREAGAFEDAMEQAESAGLVGAEVPVSSRLPGGRFVKRGLRKAMSWYVCFVAAQVRSFALSVMRVLHMMDERLGAVEARLDEIGARSSDSALISDLRDLITVSPASWSGAEDVFVERILDTLKDAIAEPRAAPTSGKARVLHADCGGGDLVSRLCSEGVDAYGVESGGALSARAGARGRDADLDLRTEELFAHLSALRDGELAGVVLSGCVDRLDVASDARLAELCAAKVRTGGVVAVVGTHPLAWQRAAPPIVVDLAPGRPLHAQTWKELLRANGVGSIVCSEASSKRAIDLIEGSDPQTIAINSVIETLVEEIMVPEAFLVMGSVGGEAESDSAAASRPADRGALRGRT